MRVPKRKSVQYISPRDSSLLSLSAAELRAGKAESLKFKNSQVSQRKEMRSISVANGGEIQGMRIPPSPKGI